MELLETNRQKLPDYLWGIETAYNKLKVDRPWESFQTTYEELKRKIEDSYREPKKLPDYLWGIETDWSC